MGGCFEWLGARDKNGRALMGVGNKNKKASRVAWYLNTGEWPPKGLNVCHHCDNPACVRFDHLFIGTQKDNMQDCSRKNRIGDRAGSNNSRSLLSEDDVRSIRSSAKKHGDGKRLAEKFSVSKSTISSIILRSGWTHI
jgi:hypothetical protein